MSGVELAACPFCGGSPVTTTAMNEHWVSCGACGASAPMTGRLKLACELWNRRAVPMEAVAWREKVIAIMEDKISGCGMSDGYWCINDSSVAEAADAILQALALIPQAEETVK